MLSLQIRDKLHHWAACTDELSDFNDVEITDGLVFFLTFHLVSFKVLFFVCRHLSVSAEINVCFVVDKLSEVFVAADNR